MVALPTIQWQTQDSSKGVYCTHKVCTEFLEPVPILIKI